MGSGGLRGSQSVKISHWLESCVAHRAASMLAIVVLALKNLAKQGWAAVIRTHFLVRKQREMNSGSG